MATEQLARPSSEIGADWWEARLAVTARTPRSGTVTSRERIVGAKARGIDVLALSGSPRIPPAPHVLEAIERAARLHPMLPAPGMPELRAAFAAKLLAQNQVPDASSEEILVTNGAKQGLHVVLASLIDSGDEVVFPAPSYVYTGTIELLGGVPRPVLMPESHGYRYDPELLERAISPRTKVLLLNNPTNPTGVVARRDELEAIAALAERHGLAILVDEAHERLIYDGRRHVSLASIPEARQRTVTVFSMSKAHNLMGHRVGFVFGPKPLVVRASAILEWEALANNFLSQAAALAVLTGPQEWLSDLRASCERNRAVLSDAIDAIDGLSGVRPEGGSTHFVNTQAIAPSGRDAADMLLEHGVPSDPGEVFGEPGHVRLTAVGSDPVVLDQAIGRLRDVCASLS